MRKSFLMLLVGLYSASATGASAQQGSDPVVLLQTTKGPIPIRIYRTAAPNTALNFLDLVSRGFYNGLTFHRIETWCIQGGDPNGNGSGDFIDPQTGRPRYLRLEVTPQLRHNAPGVVAMARSSAPDSASCQFYITKSPVPQLDMQYAVFGGVLGGGMNVVRSIGRGDRILSAEIVEGGGAAPAQSQGMQRRPAGGQMGTSAGTPTDSGF